MIERLEIRPQGECEFELDAWMSLAVSSSSLYVSEKSEDGELDPSPSRRTARPKAFRADAAMDDVLRDVQPVRPRAVFSSKANQKPLT